MNTKIPPCLPFIFIIFLLSPLCGFSEEQNDFSLSAQETYASLIIKGEQSQLKGDFDLAIDVYEGALSQVRSTNDFPAQVNVYSKLGLLFWNTGNITKSLDYYNKALSLTGEGSPEAKKALRQAIDIATFYKEGKRFRFESLYQHSINSFNCAVVLAQKIESSEHLVKCFRQLGVTYWEMNDGKRFYQTTQQALALARSIRHKMEIGRCAFNIGLYFNDVSDYSQALKHYEDALSIFRDMNTVSDVSNCLVNMSDIYIQLGNYEKALLNLTDVLVIDRQLDDDLYVAMDLNNIGVVYRKKGLESDSSEDLLKGLTFFEESLFLSRQIQAKKIEVQCLNNMGTVYTDLEKYPEALRCLFLGLDIAEILNDKKEISSILLNMGTVYSNLRRFDQAIEVLVESIELAQLINEKNILWEAHAKAGYAFKEMNSFSPAVDHFKKSIHIIESIRSKIHLEELKASYFSSDERIDSYYRLVDIFFLMSQINPGQHHIKSAFETMEKAKARAFLDRLELSKIEKRRDIDPELLEREHNLMEEISKLNSTIITPGLDGNQKQKHMNRLKRLEQDLETLNRTVRLNSPSYANLKYPRTVSLEEAQSSLPDHSTAYFAYCIGKDCSYLFVITKEKMNVFPLPPADILREGIRNYLQIITDKDRFNFQEGYDLFTVLISPGLERGINRIVFIPDDILHYLPFETLLTQTDKSRWLVQDYRISYVPSITSFREIVLRERGNHQKKDLLSFGNPYLGEFEGPESRIDMLNREKAWEDFRLNPLDYSQLEVDRIATLFKKNKRDVYSGTEATETTVKRTALSDYKIVHFATHGQIDNRYPARSSILLSLNDDSSEDGFLQMREVYHLKFNADLVTLSACQTGLGRFIKGEGIEGINRAFFFAGASSVLMSLWAVNDQASYQFMQRFYSYLCSSESIVDALRRAKIEMIKSEALSHPFYWAGFVVSGETDKIIFPSRREKRVNFGVFLLIFAAAFFVAAKLSIALP